MAKVTEQEHIMTRILISVLSVMLLSSVVRANEALEWKELPELPPAPGKVSQPGLAGAFAGVHNDALIVAGGANFPDGLPWSKLADGSSPKKIYHKEIYALQKSGPWTISDVKLPSGYSYGVSIQPRTAWSVSAVSGVGTTQVVYTSLSPTRSFFSNTWVRASRDR